MVQPAINGTGETTPDQEQENESQQPNGIDPQDYMPDALDTLSLAGLLAAGWTPPGAQPRPAAQAPPMPLPSSAAFNTPGALDPTISEQLQAAGWSPPKPTPAAASGIAGFTQQKSKLLWGMVGGAMVVSLLALGLTFTAAQDSRDYAYGLHQDLKPRVLVAEGLFEELPPALGAEIEANNATLRQEMADMLTIINHDWQTGDDEVRGMLFEALSAGEHPVENPPQ